MVPATALRRHRHPGAGRIEDGIGAWKLEAGFKSLAVVGSSLGGFYATAVAERHGCKAVLINPAVCPARDLARYIGEQTTWLNSNERFFFAPHYVDELIALQTGPIRRPMLYYPIIAKGDEVLDWREMAAYYAKANVQLLDGGDHALSDFDLQAPGILQFLALKEGPALQDCD